MLLATTKAGVEIEKYRQKKLLKTELQRVLEAYEEMFWQIEPSDAKLATTIDYEKEIKKNVPHISYVFIDLIENCELLSDGFAASLKNIANRSSIRIELFLPAA